MTGRTDRAPPLLALGLAALLACSGTGAVCAARADEGPPAGAAPAPNAPRGAERPWTPFLTAEGELRLLFRPDFRDAPSLAADLAGFGVEGLVIEPTGPMLAASDPRKPPVPGRLLLGGPPEAVSRAREILRLLDVPRASVVVSLLAVEVRSYRTMESGGHALFDRNLSPESPNTLFRAFQADFEPDAYLRSSLLGVRPYAGNSIRFGFAGKKFDKFGAMEFVLRMLAEQGDAEFLAWPTLLCTEADPGEVSSQSLVPYLVFTGGGTGNPRYELRQQQTGIRLTTKPLRVSRSGVVLSLEADITTAEETSDASAEASNTVLRSRRVRTLVSLRDRETVLIGGLKLRRQIHLTRGMPGFSHAPLLDWLGVGKEQRAEETELVFLLRARVLVPGGGGS